MGYDVTNTTSIVELGLGGSIPSGSDIVPIVLPSILPTQELVSTDLVQTGSTITLPTTIPAGVLIGMDSITPVGDIVELPSIVPPDGVILLDVVPIPGVGTVTEVRKLIELIDVSTTRTDGDVLVYNESSATYIHVQHNPDAHYVHNQGTGLQVWIINHNLGKYPSITVKTMSGTVMHPEIKHIDANNAQAIFGNATFTGVAYCN